MSDPAAQATQPGTLRAQIAAAITAEKIKLEKMRSDAQSQLDAQKTKIADLQGNLDSFGSMLDEDMHTVERRLVSFVTRVFGHTVIAGRTVIAAAPAAQPVVPESTGSVASALAGGTDTLKPSVTAPAAVGGDATISQ